MKVMRFINSGFALVGIVALFGCASLSKQSEVSKNVEGVVCNPINLSYRFQLEEPMHDEPPIEVSHREAADPSTVYYQGKYWMFLSKSGGYWWSDDLVEWNFIESKALPIEGYAPDVRIVNDAIIFTASGTKGYRSTDPMNDQWEKITDYIFGHDPHTFQDDDGKVYGFWGCSPNDPIYGFVADPETIEPTSKIHSLMSQDRDSYGWELRGDGHVVPEQKAYVEGPWLNKHNGTYYMQYAVPGTQFDIYNDSIYTSDSPLGPYTIAAHNPFAYKPKGFMTGAGHGCNFKDRYDNLWHAGTQKISIRRGFERRVGLYPAGFDADGVLFCNTRFGDYPMNVPNAKWDPRHDSFAGLMLLSLNKPVTASSVRGQRAAENAVDENVGTWWAGQSKANEWLQIDLGSKVSVKALQVNLAEEECTQYGRVGNSLHVQYVVLGSTDGKTWKTLVDKSESMDDQPHDFELLPKAQNVRYVKIEIVHMPGGGYCALAGFRVFGNKKGSRPASVDSFNAIRNEDRRFMDVSWEPVEGAHGYNVFWGIAEDKLYNCMQVVEQDSTQIRALSIHQDYFVAVEAFGETGVASLSDVKPVE